MNLRSILEEGKRLGERATKGPWVHDDGTLIVRDDRERGGWDREVLAWNSSPAQYSDEGCDSDRDGELMVHLRNTHSQLETSVGELVAALEWYANPQNYNHKHAPGVFEEYDHMIEATPCVGHTFTFDGGDKAKACLEKMGYGEKRGEG